MGHEIYLCIIIGVDGPGPQKKISSERGNREKSPGVSFAEAEEVFDFEERQYQTVHAGGVMYKIMY